MPSSKGSSESNIFSNHITITYMSKPEPLPIDSITDPGIKGIQL